MIAMATKPPREASFTSRITWEMQVLLEADPAGFSDDIVKRAASQQLASGGQRLRAQLAHDGARALGIDADEAMVLAVVCELLHNASLIHDDLADNADTRRNQPSINHTYGRGVALCLGDLYLSAAYAALAGLPSSGPLLPSLMNCLHRAIATTIHGQIGASNPANQAQLGRAMQASEAKTAALFSLALKLPLLLADHAHCLPTADAACNHFARAYQLLDDIDDYQEDVALDPDKGNGNLLRLLELEGHASSARQRALALIKESLVNARQYTSSLPAQCATPLEHAIDALHARALKPVTVGATA